MHKIRLIVVALFSFIAINAVAALSPEYRAWGQGPVKWIMSPEEARAWKSVDTDEEAARFVDLFWARRDPSEGTAENEFRSEFEARVIWADQHFGDKTTRGALTERGRFYTILGAPSRIDGAGASQSSRGGTAMSGGGSTGAPSGGGLSAPSDAGGPWSVDPTGGRQMGARSEWRWEKADAQKYGMPEILAVFVEDPITRVTSRVPQYSSVMGAVPVALKQQMIRPQLRELPEWAMRGGLRPAMLRTASATTTANDMLLGAPPAIPAEALGVTRFTLVKNANDLVTESSSDPFEGLAPVARFKASEELGWVARYCAPGEPQALKVSLRITGMVGDEKVNMNAPADEIMPDRLRAMPGCAMVRGSVPLADLAPGVYDIVVTIEDASGKPYTLQESFVVE